MGDDHWQDVGEPACWLDKVCAECGRMPDEADAAICPGCGTAIGDEADVSRRVFPDTGGSREHRPNADRR